MNIHFSTEIYVADGAQTIHSARRGTGIWQWGGG